MQDIERTSAQLRRSASGNLQRFFKGSGRQRFDEKDSIHKVLVNQRASCLGF